LAEYSITVLNRSEDGRVEKCREYYRKGRRITYMQWQETRKNGGREAGEEIVKE
jgi:hypothetical protein